MDLKDFKLYNVCVMRLRHQIEIARGKEQQGQERMVLESYCTGDMEEIIDIHELYDIEDRNLKGVMSKLGQIAADASLFVNGKVEFDFNQCGELCLYLVLRDPHESAEPNNSASAQEELASV